MLSFCYRDRIIKGPRLRFGGTVFCFVFFVFGPRRTLGLNELESLRDVVFILDSRSWSGMTRGAGKANVECRSVVSGKANIEYRTEKCRISKCGIAFGDVVIIGVDTR